MDPPDLETCLQPGKTELLCARLKDLGTGPELRAFIMEPGGINPKLLTIAVMQEKPDMLNHILPHLTVDDVIRPNPETGETSLMRASFTARDEPTNLQLLMTVPGVQARHLAMKSLSDGFNVLHFACRFNKEKVVRYILDIVIKETENGDPPMVMQSLLWEADVYGDIPLFYACAYGCLEIVKMLLDAMNSPSYRVTPHNHFLVRKNMRNLRIPLHSAVTNDSKAVPLLLDFAGPEIAKAQLESTCYDRQTALHCAVNRDNEEMTRLLLHYVDALGCDDVLFIKDHDGRNVFNRACFRQDTDIMRVLHQHFQFDKDLQDQLIGIKGLIDPFNNAIEWCLLLGGSNTTPIKLALCYVPPTKAVSICKKLLQTLSGGPMLIAEDYLTAPDEKREIYRREFDLHIHDAACAFAMVVSLCDGYFTLNQDNTGESRFFQIASKLPMELQAIVCNRACGSNQDSPPTKAKLDPILYRLLKPNVSTMDKELL